MVKAAVGQRTAQAFVKKKEHQDHLDTFGCELTGIAAAIAFQPSRSRRP
jgi:hypothetical protein